jgi:hypothetical protein
MLSSGALDYVRHAGITGTGHWTLQNGDNLIAELNALLNAVERLYIFGATYSTGIGVRIANTRHPPAAVATRLVPVAAT